MSDVRPPSPGASPAAGTARPHRAARAVNLIALAIGLVAFGFVVRALGWSGLRDAIIGVGGWFAVMAVIDFASACCDAYGLYAFVRPHSATSYRQVFAAQLSGMAINRLTPGNTIGEPIKVTMLVRTDVPADVAVAAVMQFQLVNTYVAIAAIVAGVPLTALLMDMPANLGRFVWGAAIALVVIAIALLVLVRRGLLGLVIRVLAGLRVIGAPRAERWQRRVATVDAQLGRIGRLRAPGLAAGLAGVIGSRVFNWAGTIVVLHAADIPMTAPLIVASLSVGLLVTWLSNVIPLGLGLADGGNYVLYGLLGASPAAGLLFTTVNRVRTMVLALMGLAVMTIANALYRRAG